MGGEARGLLGKSSCLGLSFFADCGTIVLFERNALGAVFAIFQGLSFLKKQDQILILSGPGGQRWDGTG